MYTYGSVERCATGWFSQRGRVTALSFRRSENDSESTSCIMFDKNVSWKIPNINDSPLSNLHVVVRIEESCCYFNTWSFATYSHEIWHICNRFESIYATKNSIRFARNSKLGILMSWLSFRCLESFKNLGSLERFEILENFDRFRELGLYLLSCKHFVQAVYSHDELKVSPYIIDISKFLTKT